MQDQQAAEHVLAANEAFYAAINARDREGIGSALVPDAVGLLHPSQLECALGPRRCARELVRDHGES
jgi:ketosteroid isomerase-like protein